METTGCLDLLTWPKWGRFPEQDKPKKRLEVASG